MIEEKYPEVQLLFKAGKDKGYLLYEEIQTVLSDEVSSEPKDLEEVYTRFFDLGIEIVTDPASRPVYFHCWRGKDRTGAMCAAYRMAVQGWDLSAARREMDLLGFFKGWKNLSAWVDAFPVGRAKSGARQDRCRRTGGCQEIQACCLFRRLAGAINKNRKLR